MKRNVLIALATGWLLGLVSPVVAALLVVLLATCRRPDGLTAADLDANGGL